VTVVKIGRWLYEKC